MTTVAVLEALVKADTASAEAAFARVSEHADAMGERVGGAGRIVAGAGAVMAAGLAVGVGAAAAAVSSFAGFEQTISAIGAVSDASKADLDALSATALKLGKETSFSAKEAAEGMEELAKAGMSTADIIGGGAAAALNLAAAGGVNVGEAAAIASTAMTVFNKDASEMGGVVDRIAGFANATAGSVTDFKFSMAATGAVAKLVGVSFEDTATAISLMGKAGILGSDAGTSLKTMFANLTPQTKTATAEFEKLGIIVNGQNRFFDENTGKLKSLDQVAGILKETLGGLDKEAQLKELYKLFGSDAIRAGSVLLEAGAEGFRDMGDAIGGISAAEVAAKRLDNLNGSIEQMKGSAETLAIMFGQQLAPGVRVAVNAVTDFLNSLIDNQGLQDFIGQVGTGLGNAVRTGVAALETLGTEVTNLFGVLTSTGGDRAGFLKALGLDDQTASDVGAILDRVQQAFDTFSTDWGAGFQALGDVAGEIVTYVSPIAESLISWLGEQAGTIAANLGQWAQAFLDWVEPLIPPMLSAMAAIGEAVLTWIGEQVVDIAAQLVQWGTAFVEWVAPQIPGLIDQLSALGGAFFGWLAEQIPQIISQLDQWGTAFVEWVAPRIGPMLASLAELLVQLNVWLIGTALPTIVGHLAEWGVAFVEWVAPYIPQLIGRLVEMNVAIFEWMAGTALPGIVQQLVAWGEAFVNWVAPIVGRLLGELGNLLGQLLGWISSAAAQAFTAASTIGSQLIDGLVSGVQAKIGAAVAAVQGAAGSVIDAAKAAFGVHSPSTEFAEIGSNLMAGLAQGIDDSGDTVVSGVEDWINRILNAATTALGGTPSYVFSQLGDGAAKGFMLGLLGQQQGAIDAALQLANATGDAFAGPITAKIGDLTVEQARKVRSALESAAKAQQDVIDKTAVAQQKYADAVAKVGQKTHDQAVAAAQDAAIAADKAVEVAAKATRNVQEAVSDALTKNADDAAKAAKKTADEATKAAEKAAKEAEKAAKDAIKASMEAVADFKDFLTKEIPGIGKQVALSLDLMGAIIEDMLAPAKLSAAQEALLKAAKQWKAALGKEFKPGQMTPVIAAWLPQARDPRLIKQMEELGKNAAKGFIDTVGTALKGGDWFTGHFTFLANQIASGSGPIGEFFNKALDAFTDFGTKAGQSTGEAFGHAFTAAASATATFQYSGSAPSAGQAATGVGLGWNAAAALISALGGLPGYVGIDNPLNGMNSNGQANGNTIMIGGQPVDFGPTGTATINGGGDPNAPGTPVGGSGNNNAGLGSGLGPVDTARNAPISSARYAGLSNGNSGGSGGSGSLYGTVAAAVTDALSALGTGPQLVTIPVYVGGRKVDEVVYDANRRAIRRTY